MRSISPFPGRLWLMAAILAVASERAAWSLEAPSPSKAIIVAPGPDTAKVITFLQRIEKEASKADTDLYSQNILLKGRLSQLYKYWKEGIVNQSPETMPSPRSGEFTLVHKNGKRRFDLDLGWLDRVTKSGSKKVYRLADGDNVYKVGFDYLEILGNKNAAERWRRDLAADYFIFEWAHDGRNWQPLSKVCQILIDRLNGISVSKDYWKTHTVRCYQESGLLIIDFDERGLDPQKDRYRFRYVFWVDPKKGYRLVKKFIEQRGPTGGLDSREQAELDVSEVVPGVFVAMKARFFASILGTAAKKKGQAGWRTMNLDVSEARVGDFPYDEALLDKKSLPISVGAQVVDLRFDPPRRFIHGVKSLDEELAQSALGHEKSDSKEEKTTKLLVPPGRLSERIAEAQAEGRSHYLRVLLIVGDLKDAKTRFLTELREANPALRKALLEYEQVAVTANDAETIAVLRESYLLGAEQLKTPALVVLGEGGNVLASKGLLLEAKDAGSAALEIKEFLETYSLPRRDAEKLLADAQDRARRQSKRVFLQETGAYCSWCRVLSHFIQKNNAILDPNYVFVEIDRSRFDHGDEVMKRYRTGKDGGIPWCAILDADGKVLVNWDGPKGNIGFPNEAHEIEHFLHALAITASRLEPAQLAELRQDLERRR